MSTIKDTTAPLAGLDARLADRIRAERLARQWTVAQMAEASGVSRAMISKIERAEASPTASLLGRLSGAFGLTLSTLLARAEGSAAEGGRVARAAQQPLWRDPASAYVRRAVSPPGTDPELVQVELPPGARVPFPASSFDGIRGQCVWVLEGTLAFREGTARHDLAEGDCLALGPPTECEYHNPGGAPCRYLVAISRRSG